MNDNYMFPPGLISVIMPAYNAENFITESIESVISQTYINWELIIIDDGSSDRTSEISQKYCLIDSRIKYVHQKNSKQAKARNLGIEISKGHILAFLDADDLWLPNKLEISLLHFDQANYDLLFTDCFVLKNKVLTEEIEKLKTMRVGNNTFEGKSAIRTFFDKNQIPILTVLVKKDVVIQVGKFNEEMVPAEDFDLWLKLLRNGFCFKSINIPLSIYREHESSSTAKDRHATAEVLRSIFFNFSKSDIFELNVQFKLKMWIIRFINILTQKNTTELICYLKKYDLFTRKIGIILYLYKVSNSSYIKNLLIKKLDK